MEKPKWEIKFEEYQNEEPVSKKIGIMKKELEENKKVKGDFKTKEEYEAAKTKHEKLRKSKEEKIKGYENYENNKTRIKNILEYRNLLVEELEKLHKDPKEDITIKKAELDKNEKTLENQEKMIDDLIEYINKNPKSSDLVEKREQLDVTLNVVKNLKEQRGKISEELKQLESIQKSYEEKVEPQKATYERRIAKCNIIAEKLLKGKELGKFKLKVEEKPTKYTAKDAKMAEEVKEAREAKPEVVEQEEAKPEVVEQEEAKPEVVEQEVAEPETTEQTVETTGLPEVKKVSLLQKFKNFVKRFMPKKEEVEEENVLSEEDRYRIITQNRGKFVSDYIEAQKAAEQVVAEKKVAKPEAAKQSETEQKATTDKAEKDEDDFLIDVTNNGFREALRKQYIEHMKAEARKEEEAKKAKAEHQKAIKDKYVENKKNAANKYAKEYGGRYENQDGATAKKVESPEKESEDLGR